MRSLAGSVRGDGNFMLSGTRYPFRVSSGQGPDGNGTRVHLNIDPGQRALAIDLDGVLNFDARAPRFEGAMTLAAPAQKGKGDELPWRIAAKVKADYSAARLEQVEVTYGPEERALKLSGSGDVRFGAEPLLRAALSARQLDADRFVAKDNATEPVRALPALRALAAAVRTRVRAGHARRTPVAGHRCRIARRYQILEPPKTGVPRARRDQGFTQRGQCEERYA